MISGQNHQYHLSYVVLLECFSSYRVVFLAIRALALSLPISRPEDPLLVLVFFWLLVISRLVVSETQCA